MRRYLKRVLPEHTTFRDHPHLRRFGSRLQDPNLWHLSRRSVPGAVSVGLFIAFLPLPFQMLLAAAVAIVVRVNLPISVALVWVTNPLTIPVVFYAAYRVGAWILDEPVLRFTIEPTLEWLLGAMGVIGWPLVVGSLVFSVTAAVAGNLLVRGLWRLRVVRYRQERRLRAARDRNA